MAGEIHSNWRDAIIEGIKDLPVTIYHPEKDHDRSDDAGDVLGLEEQPFWKDRKSASINAIRIKNGIEKSEIVIVKFGEKYRQWNSAFDAGFAVAKGKSLIVIHPEEFNHALKEIDAAASAVARTEQQVVEIIMHLCSDL